jgi:AraC-like DNA-binding protein
VDIAAFLQPSLLANLSVVVGGRHRILAADSWDQLSLRIRSEPIDLAVLDPSGSGEVRSDAILDVLDEFPSVPVILYTQLAPATIQPTISLARAGVRHVVLFRYDDDPKRFLELIESEPGAAFAQMLLQRLEVPLRLVGPNLRRGIERMFGAPGHFVTIPDLARTAIVSTRTIYRKFNEAGFASPRKFLVAARLLRAYAYMREPGNTLESAGEKLGYDSGSFRRQVRIFFNTTPNLIRRHMPPEEFVERLAVQLYPDLTTDTGR